MKRSADGYQNLDQDLTKLRIDPNQHAIRTTRRVPTHGLISKQPSALLTIGLALTGFNHFEILQKGSRQFFIRKQFLI
jgi:hypothetical protein